MSNDVVGDTKGKLTGWHVLAILVICFGVVISVNIYFAFMANKTFSGDDDHAYMEGLKFNETLDEKHKQIAEGWDMSLGFTRGAGGDALFTATMVDKNKQPLSGLELKGKLFRGTEDKDDKPLIFNEVAAGKYVARIEKLGPGKWDFVATGTKKGFSPFHTETSLSIR